MVEGAKNHRQKIDKDPTTIIGGKENISLPSAGSSVAQHFFLSLHGQQPELQAELPLEKRFLPQKVPEFQHVKSSSALQGLKLRHQPYALKSPKIIRQV